MSVVDTLCGKGRSTRRPADRLSAARLAFRATRTDERQRDAAKRFSAQYLRRLSAVLPLDEISAILAAEQAREQGLASSRAGDDDTATLLLAQADALCEQAGLSRHARVAAQSFQFAAEAYLHHRRGDGAAAIRALENAIVTTSELELVYGHDMEFRRVHLARNILRVRAGMAADRAILADSVALLRYIGGDAARWPIAAGHGVGDPANMADSQRSWAIDELLLNLTLPSVDPGALAALLPPCEDRGDTIPDLRAAIRWCRASAKLRLGDRQRGLDEALLFFDGGGSRLVHAGQFLDGLLDRLGIQADE